MKRPDIPRILYEDNHILVAVKPPGVLSQSDGGTSDDMLTLLQNDLRERHNKPGRVYLGLVHRLDQPVGGVMVFARTSKAAGRLSEQIRTRTLEKYYLAVVCGVPHPPQGQRMDRLSKNRRINQVQVSQDETGQMAVLQYQLLVTAEEESLSLLALKLDTGRPHQIRVQLSHAGWPIYGDRRYGRQQDRLPAEREKRSTADNRPALFSAAITLTHPTRQDRHLFAAEPPDEWPWSLFAAEKKQNLPDMFTEC